MACDNGYFLFVKNWWIWLDFSRGNATICYPLPALRCKLHTVITETDNTKAVHQTGDFGESEWIITGTGYSAMADAGHHVSGSAFKVLGLSKCPVVSSRHIIRRRCQTPIHLDASAGYLLGFFPPSINLGNYQHETLTALDIWLWCCRIADRTLRTSNDEDKNCCPVSTK